MSNSNLEKVKTIELENEKFINIVCSQTNYNKVEAFNKLSENNFDYVKVIRDYIKTNKNNQHTNKVKSINQEIYKQIRYNLDQSSLQYQKKNPIQLNQVVSNFRESELKNTNKI